MKSPMYDDLDKIMTDAARVAAVTNRKQHVRYLVVDGVVSYYITTPTKWRPLALDMGIVR